MIFSNSHSKEEAELKSSLPPPYHVFVLALVRISFIINCGVRKTLGLMHEGAR